MRYILLILLMSCCPAHLVHKDIPESISDTLLTYRIWINDSGECIMFNPNGVVIIGEWGKEDTLKMLSYFPDRLYLIDTSIAFPIPFALYKIEQDILYLSLIDLKKSLDSDGDVLVMKTTKIYKWLWLPSLGIPKR